MSGRVNTNRNSSSILNRRKHHQDFYKSIQRCLVKDVHLEKGTLTVVYLTGGSSLEVPMPLVGLSIPADAKDLNYQNVSWGVYIPQVDDVILVGFDPLGTPFSLSYHYLNFRDLKDKDDAYESKGGIGWGDASGKRLKPGDWTFKSARGCSLYMGDRTRITSGTHSITLDKTLPNGEISIQTDHLHTYYGTIAERREGFARRFLAPGVDTQEGFVTGTFGTVAQECTNYVRRGSAAALGGKLLMVHKSDGEVINDILAQVMVPATAYPALGASLVGTNARMLRAVKDDATGLIDMYAMVVDNLGNLGVEAKTATGVQWFTPLSTWTVNSNMVLWTSTATFDIVTASFAVTASASAGITATSAINLTSGLATTITSGATLGLTSSGLMTLTAPTLKLSAGAIQLGASPVTLTASDELNFEATSMSFNSDTSIDLEAGTTAKLTGGTSVTLDAPAVNLGGLTASEFLVKGTSFIAQMNVLMTGMNAMVAAVIADPAITAVLPATKAAFVAFGPIGIAFQTQLATMLSTTTKTT